MKFYTLSGWGLALALSSQLAAAETFTLIIDNNRSPGDTVYVQVMPGSADNWDAEPATRLKQVLPETDSLDLPLDLAAGRYAIRAFVDTDGDAELATGAMGKPKEPFASSIGTGRKRPAISLDRSVFELNETRPSVTLTLRYPR